MNDFSELESELKQLRPAAPSADLLARVERTLEENPVGTATAGILPRRPKSHWWALGLGLAGATAAFFFLARTNVDRPATPPPLAEVKQALPPTQPSGPSLLPDGVTRVVYQTSDEGLVLPANAIEPARRLRSRSRETLQWRDPGSGASLRVSYPTEEVELIPVSISVQ